MVRDSDFFEWFYYVEHEPKLIIIVFMFAIFTFYYLSIRVEEVVNCKSSCKCILLNV